VVRSMSESHRAGNRAGFGQVMGAAALIFEALGHHEAPAARLLP
jgi:hypothetical protein